MAEKRRKLFNTAILCVSLVVSIGLAERTIRYQAPQAQTPLGGFDPTGLRTTDPALGFVHRPNFSGPWVRGIHVETNTLGLRDDEYGAKQPAELRILSLGDSYAFGFGVTADDAYATVLEGMLQSHLPDTEVSVINAGVSGYNTYQQILMFERLAPLLKPDFVLATFVGSNDVHENAKFAQALAQQTNTPVGWLGRNSHLYRAILRAAYPVTFFVSNRWNPNIDETIHALEELKQRFESAEVPYLFIIIPARHQVQPHVHRGARFLAFLGLDWLILHQNKQIATHFSRTGIPYVDVHQSLAEHDKKRSVYFHNDAHANAAGHHVIGRKLGDRLIKVLNTDDPSRAVVGPL